MTASDYLEWQAWWRERGFESLREILLKRWDPLGVRDDAARHGSYDHWVTRLGTRLRHGTSSEEVYGFLLAASEELGVHRIRHDQLAAAAMEVRAWYRREQGDGPRDFWPVSRTRPEV